MNHLSEEQLILYYYGEEGDTLAAEQHLEGCEECRGMYASLQRVLNVVDSLPVPERGPEYGAQLWRRLESQLPVRRRFQWVFSPWRWAAAAAFAGLLVAAFLAGRYSPRVSPSSTQMAGTSVSDPQVRERILLVAVGDYLERSQMVLVELANADPKGGPLDISATQERASDLLTENRLYRQTADHTGDTAVSSVLDDLDRVLLEIAHAPSRLSAADVEQFRQRLHAEGILFKIRVLGSNVRNQEDAAGGSVPAARQKL
jgi:hypothetical protein